MQSNGGWHQCLTTTCTGMNEHIHIHLSICIVHACAHTHASTSRHTRMYVPVHKRLVNLSSVGSWYAILFWQKEVKTWASRTLLDYAQRACVSFLVTVTKLRTKADYRGFILVQLFDAVAYCQWRHEDGTRNHDSRCRRNWRFWTRRQSVTFICNWFLGSAAELCCLHLGWVLPPQLRLFGNAFTDTPRGLSLRVFWIPSNWQD